MVWRGTEGGPNNRLRFHISAALLDIFRQTSAIFSYPFLYCINSQPLTISSKMGWFWGSSSQDDPVKKLDPGLREYLENEAPAKYVPTTSIPSTQEPSKTLDPRTQAPKASASAETGEPSKPSVPSASLFPDGRYAHLWKTYKPPQEEDGSATKGAERVIEKYKKHNDTVHRAAMENCALEHEALTLCFQTGNWQKRLQARVTSCSEENATFSRCFTTQSVSTGIISPDLLLWAGYANTGSEIPPGIRLRRLIRLGRGEGRANSNACG
jgi:hypothetical protein